jgi:hypothetical protein
VSEYIVLPIETDPDTIVDSVHESLRVRFPDWEPADGNLDQAMIEAFADVASEIRDLASQVPPAIFRYLGSRLANIPFIAAQAAIATSTWTAIDAAGHQIPAGTQVGIRDVEGNLVPFIVADTVTIFEGATTTNVGEVSLVASIAGAASTGLGGPGTAVELIDALDWVQSVTLVTATSGGRDDELDTDYLDRLREELQLLTPRPILPRDFAIIARRVAGVYRSLAIDGFIPPSLTNQERAIAVANVDESGAAVSSTVKDDVRELLQNMRETNFIVNTIDPTYTSIDVSATVVVDEGYVLDDVRQAVIDAVSDYLSPANWGTPRGSTDRDWVLVNKVRVYDLTRVISGVSGVTYIESGTLRIAAHGNSLGTADVALNGAAPLTTPGTISITPTS